MWFLPESPKFLLELNRLDDAEAAMIRIAWFNGDSFDPFELSELNTGVRSPLASSRRGRRDSYDSVLKHSNRQSARSTGILSTVGKTSGLYEDDVEVEAPPVSFFLKQRPI